MKTRKQDSNIIRVGDRMILNDPRPIERIGYEVSVETMIPEVEKDPDIVSFIKSQKLIVSSASRLIKTVAMSRVRYQMKRGAKRKVIYRATEEQYRGQIVNVLEKRIHRIGTYYPALGGYNGYYDEYEHEPAGLDNATSVVCLCLNVYCQISDGSSIWDGFWVTSDQVSKIIEKIDE